MSDATPTITPDAKSDDALPFTPHEIAPYIRRVLQLAAFYTLQYESSIE